MDLSQFTTFRAAAADINGQWRGKRLPASAADKLDKGALRMPLSVMNLDIWGQDIEDSPLVFESGDADGILRPTGRGPVPMPWLARDGALVPMAMYCDDGTPFGGDPRHALAAVLERYSARGWSVVAATEMEFTLVNDRGETLLPPTNPRNGRALSHAAILSLDELDAFEAFFSDVYDGAALMGIPVQSAIAEGGVGQFEVTLLHQDAMKAADDAVLFKSLLRGMARNHGMAATFMAKPFENDAGNGMHVHFSVVDDTGANVFDDGGDHGTDTLRHAVAGCVAMMPASTLVFAPHDNSYARLVPGAHAPTGACWAYENRTAAIRIPGGAPAARRIEHRVAGGDINPYLMLATVLGAAIEGIEQTMQPPAPITGNAYDLDLPQLAPDMESAIDRFATDTMLARILPAQLIDNLVRTKRQEHALIAEIAPDARWQSYLETV